MITFSERHALGELFGKWCDRHGVKKCPESMATWLYSEELLDEKKTKEYLKDPPAFGEKETRPEKGNDDAGKTTDSYVRTNAGVYPSSKVELHDGHRACVLGTGKWSKYIGESDSIEELCERCVVEIEGLEPFALTFYEARLYIDTWKRKLQSNFKIVAIYASIWTKKGLIHVAKMNEEGGWDLL